MFRKVMLFRWLGLVALLVATVAFATKGFRGTPLRGRLLGGETPWSKLERQLQTRVSLDLDQATWSEALSAIAEQTGVVIADRSQELNLQEQSSAKAAGPPPQVPVPPICLKVTDVTLETALELLLLAGNRRLSSDGDAVGGAPSLSGEPLGEGLLELAVVNGELAVKLGEWQTSYFPHTSIVDEKTSVPPAYSHHVEEPSSVLLSVGWRRRRLIKSLRTIDQQQPDPHAHQSIPLTNRPAPELQRKLRQPLPLRAKGTRLAVLTEVFKGAKIPWGYLGGYRDDRIIEVIGRATTQDWIASLLTDELGCRIVGDHVLIGARSFTAHDGRAYPLTWTDQDSSVLASLQHITSGLQRSSLEVHGGHVVIVASTDVHWQCDRVLNRFSEAALHGIDDAPVQLPPSEARTWKKLKQRVTWPAHRLSLPELLRRIAVTYDLSMILPSADSLTQRWDAVDDRPLWAALDQHLFALNHLTQLRPGGILDTTHHSTRWISPAFLRTPSALLPLRLDERRRQVGELLDGVRDREFAKRFGLGERACSPGVEVAAVSLAVKEFARLEHVLDLLERAKHDALRLEPTAGNGLATNADVPPLTAPQWSVGKDSEAVDRWRRRLNSSTPLMSTTVSGVASELSRRWKIPVQYTEAAAAELARSEMAEDRRLTAGPFLQLLLTSSHVRPDQPAQSTATKFRRVHPAPLPGVEQSLGQAISQTLATARMTWELTGDGVVFRLAHADFPTMTWGAVWVGDILDLLNPSAPDDLGQFAISSVPRVSLLQMLRSHNPWAWGAQGGMGYMTLVNDVLLVRTTDQELQSLQRHLALLRRLPDAEVVADIPMGQPDGRLPTVSIAARQATVFEYLKAIERQTGRQLDHDAIEDWLGSKYDKMLLNIPADRAAEVMVSSLQDPQERLLVARRSFYRCRRTALVDLAPPYREPPPERWQDLVSSNRELNFDLTSASEAIRAQRLVSDFEAMVGSGQTDSLVLKLTNQGKVWVTGYRYLVDDVVDAARSLSGESLTMGELPGWNHEIASPPGPRGETIWEALLRVTAGSALPLATHSLHEVANRPAPRDVGQTTGEALEAIADALSWTLYRQGDIVWLTKNRKVNAVRGYHLANYGLQQWKAQEAVEAIRFVFPVGSPDYIEAFAKQSGRATGGPTSHGLVAIGTVADLEQVAETLRWLPAAKELSAEQLEALIQLEDEELEYRLLHPEQYTIEERPPNLGVVYWAVGRKTLRPEAIDTLREKFAGRLSTKEIHQIATIFYGLGARAELDPKVIRQHLSRVPAVQPLLERVAMVCCGEPGRRMLLEELVSRPELQRAQRVFRQLIDQEGAVTAEYTSLTSHLVDVMAHTWDLSVRSSNAGDTDTMEGDFWRLVGQLDPQWKQTEQRLNHWLRNGGPEQRTRAKALLERLEARRAESE